MAPDNLRRLEIVLNVNILGGAGAVVGVGVVSYICVLILEYSCRIKQKTITKMEDKGKKERGGSG